MTANCTDCARLAATGRREVDPVHCQKCHATWTGNEAQHCTKCHRTFSGVSSSDHHRWRKLPDGTTEDRCIDPAVTDGWREKRPGVWTDGATWAGIPAA